MPNLPTSPRLAAASQSSRLLHSFLPPSGRQDQHEQTQLSHRWQIFWTSLFGAKAAQRIFTSLNGGPLAAGLFVAGLGFLLLSYAGFRAPIMFWPCQPDASLAGLHWRDWLILLAGGFIGTGSAMLLAR